MKTDKTKQLIEIPVKFGQKMSEIPSIYPLPSNCIFHKILPGLGATYGEINAPRHSIIVLPNVPVIKDKVKDHNKKNPKAKHILGVHKGIAIEIIAAYMNDETIVHKKILTTPEGYDGKVKEALKDIIDYVKKEFYLLIDECERTIQDVDFREKIIAPFDDLFSFTNKGLISATTLPFSDPRIEQEFTHYLIKPDFDYSQPLRLIHTNNVVAATRKYFTDTNSDCYFIFLTSIKTITALINSLGIKSESKIHCSESRKTELKLRQFKTDSDFEKDKLAKYNFFTSRFYSAVDMELTFKPDVLMITEVVFAEHSILDPKTEVIQIAGRLRNGVNSITHITNSNTEISFKTSDEVRFYMNGQQDVYKQILSLKQRMDNPGAIEAINQILTEPSFAKYFKRDGEFNWFMIDNLIQEERVLGLYQCTGNLKAAYKEVNSHFNVTAESQTFPLSDKDRLKLDSIDSRKELTKEIVKQLKRLTPTMNNYVLGGEDMLNDLRNINPMLFEAYQVIGEEGIKKAGYLESTIKSALEDAKKVRLLYSHEVISDVHQALEGKPFEIESEITLILQDIYKKHGINRRARPGQIQEFFNAWRSYRNGARVYVIEEKLSLDNCGKSSSKL